MRKLLLNNIVNETRYNLRIQGKNSVLTGSVVDQFNSTNKYFVMNTTAFIK